MTLSNAAETTTTTTTTKPGPVVATASSSSSREQPNSAATTMNELSMDFSKVYRNNPHQILPVCISSSPSKSSSSRRRRNEKLAQVAISLCPELVLSALPPPPPSDEPAEQHSYFWRFASPAEQLEQRSSSPRSTAEEGIAVPVVVASLKDDNDTEEEQQQQPPQEQAVVDNSVVVISVFSSQFSTSSSHLIMTIPLKIRPLTGGLSNLLFIVESPVAKSTRSVLVRIHPSSEGDVVDRDYENELLAWLSRRHHHAAAASAATTAAAAVDVPIFYGRFENGRVEEFYQNVRPLSCHEMKEANQHDTKQDRASCIARLLARMHSTTTLRKTIEDHNAFSSSSSDAANGDNGSIDPCPLLHKTTVLQHGSHSYTGDIVPRIESWLNRLDRVLNAAEADSKASSSSSHQSRSSSSSSIMEEQSLVAMRCLLKKEWAWLQTNLFSSSASCPADETETVAVAARKFCRQVVLTHMDAQSLNLLVDANDKDQDDESSSQQPNHDGVVARIHMKLIDFEYAGFNPRAADIANTFCEHCDINNLRAKYQDEYPTPTQQEHFLRAYLDELSSLSDNDNDDDMSILRQYYTNTKNEKEKNAFVRALGNEIGRYTLLSHLGWAVWSCVQQINRQESSNSGADDSGRTNNASSSSSDDADKCGDATNEPAEDEFDYLAYARHRMDGYRYFEKRFMS